MRRLISLSLIAVAAIAGCNREETEAAPSAVTFTAAAPAAQPASGGSSSTATAGAGADLAVRGSGNSEVATFRRNGEDVVIDYIDAGAKKTLVGQKKDSGKRKYVDASGAVVAEVKPGDDGFKVRTADGKLLWKIKIKDDKIKISDNEENKNPWTLKISGDKIKIEDPAEKEIGRVRYYADRSKVEVKDAADAERFSANGKALSAAMGALFFDAIPQPQRLIIAGELYARGK